MEGGVLGISGCSSVGISLGVIPNPSILFLRPSTSSSSSTTSNAKIIRKKTNTATISASATATSGGPDRAVGAPIARKSSPSRGRQHAKHAALVDIRNSHNLISALARSGEVLKTQDLNIILREFGRSKQYTNLSQLFDWMEKHGKVNISSYSSYIKFTGESSNPMKALDVYNSISDDAVRKSTSISNSILHCLIKNNKFDSAINLFHHMKQIGLEPDVVTYSTLLSGCIRDKNGHAKAMQLVREMEDRTLQMDAVTYGTLMAVYAANGQCKEAEECFLRMKHEGHSPNIYHYSSLLNAFSTDGNCKKADELVNEMKSAGLVPNKVMLTTLLKVYARSGLFERSRELLSELEGLGYAKDEMPYCILMDSLSKSGQIDEARIVFEEMCRLRVKSDGYAYSIMISAFCRGGKLEEAKQLARDYEAVNDKFDVVILNTMLCAYCRVGDMDSVMQIMKKMDASAIVPDKNTFGILIKYFCKEKMYLLAYKTVEDMHGKAHQPSEEICTSLMINLGKVGAHSEAYGVYNILRYSKRTVCKALHERILRILIAGQLLKEAFVVVKDNATCISETAIKKFFTAFMKSGNVNMINNVIKATCASGCKIDQEVFQLAISRYIAQPEKKELLLQLLKWMPSQGYVVDSATRNLILKNSHLYGHQLIAEILSTQHALARSTSTR